MSGTALASAEWRGRSATASAKRSAFEIHGQGDVRQAAIQAEAATALQQRETRMRDRVVARLRVLGRYGAGWDGEQASAPRRRAIEDAIAFVANLGLDPPFSASLEPDGGVVLALGDGGRRLVLVFEGNGKADMHVRRPNGELWFAWNAGRDSTFQRSVMWLSGVDKRSEV